MARTRSPPTEPVEGLRRRNSETSTVKDGLPETSTKGGTCEVVQQENLWNRGLSHAGEGDFAGGPVRCVSLSAPGLLASACCCLPAAIIFPGIAFVVICALLWPVTSFYVAMVLTIIGMSFSVNLAMGGMVGAWHMKRDVEKDWDGMLLQLFKDQPELAEDTSHIVVLPNYKEDEQMLLQTLQNIARSPMAKKNIRVVLAMEEREGPAGKAKAERLIASTSCLFADIFASYHPANLPGDVAGKSSNSAWAYTQILQRYAALLSKLDLSRVFLTVGDADTLWHPKFWSALAYQALQLSAEERVWSMFQPPILLTRNLFSVPGVTRLSSYATTLFELSGLANQSFGSALTYSAYSMTLALATHPLVGGWDRDVIAEDHHMFAKCYFAALWEQIGEVKGSSKSVGSTKKCMPLVSKLQVRPVYLPAISYLVESSDGWLASVTARFQQARRHSQGIAEVSYILLQYIKVLSAAGPSKMTFRTHLGIIAVLNKLVTVHFTNQLHVLSTIITALSLVPGIVQWVLQGGLLEILRQALAGASLDSSSLPQVGARAFTCACCVLGPIPPVFLLMVLVTWFVIREWMTGHLFQEMEDKKSEAQAAIPLLAKSTRMSLYKQTTLFLWIFQDFVAQGQLTLLLFGLIPVTSAAWSLLRNGTKFEYIVAAKPV